MEILPLAVWDKTEDDVNGVVAWLDGGGGVDARCAEREGATLLMAAALGGQATPY